MPLDHIILDTVWINDKTSVIIKYQSTSGAIYTRAKGAWFSDQVLYWGAYRVVKLAMDFDAGRRCFTLCNYHPEGIKNLCNGIVISAVKDARSGAITKEEFCAFIYSWWAVLLLRDAIDPDVIYKEVYPE